MPDATATLLLLFFAAAIERAVELVIAVLPEDRGVALRRLVAVTLAIGFGGGLAFGLELDLVGPLLGDEGGLSAAQGRAATALALAGGAAPAHELIRLIEEKKTRAKEGG